MDLCSSFPSSTDCMIAYDNLYDLKLVTLGILTLIFFYIYWNKDKFEIKSYYDYWCNQLSNIFPKLYFVFLPLFCTFLLRSTIDFELFVLLVIGFYFIALVIFIGLAFLFGQASVFKIFGFKDWEDFKDKVRDMKEERHE